MRATTPDHGQVVPNSGRGGVDAAELFGQREGALASTCSVRKRLGSCFEVGQGRR